MTYYNWKNIVIISLDGDNDCSYGASAAAHEFRVSMGGGSQPEGGGLQG